MSSLPVVVMGVSGSGKSTIGSLLAEELGVPFVDGDLLHPVANVDKMRAGIPLDDADRAPWLEAIGEVLARGSVVVASSALRRRYRDRLREFAPDLVLVHLDGPRELLAQRIGRRSHEYMPASLLQSQLATLEPPEEDEQPVRLDITRTPGELVERAAEQIKERI